MTVTIRPAEASETAVIQRTLWLALTWNGVPEGATFERAKNHPAIALYHRGWGRPGDAAVVAVDGETIVGAAFGRLFTEEDHGHGFVDADTPEIGIAVEPEHIGLGIGTRLMAALEETYRDLGVRRLSLSVNLPNPAMRLYERLGYVELDRDDDSARMVKEL